MEGQFFESLESNLMNCSNQLGNFTNLHRFHNELKASVLINKTHGPFCEMEFSNVTNESSTAWCQIKDGFFDLRTCTIPYGNTWLTFSLYFTVRVFNKLGQDISYAIMDGKNMEAIAEHKGDYPTLMMFESIAGTLGPPIAGYLITDSSDPYSKAVYGSLCH